MGKKHIVLVTGGQRSGKSGYAQKLALSLTANPVYLATSRVWDEEFRERVLRHQAGYCYRFLYRNLSHCYSDVCKMAQHLYS